MFVAYRDHGCLHIPGERTEYVELDGRQIGLRSHPPYLLDGEMEPGWTLSPIRTDIVFTHYADDGDDYESNRRVRPVVCGQCHDSGEDGSWPNHCGGCDGYGPEKNLYRCADCETFSKEELPLPSGSDHRLLAARRCQRCALEALRGVVEDAA